MHRVTLSYVAIILPLYLFAFSTPAVSLVGEVLSEQKISALEGGIVGGLRPGDYFGSSVAAVGDIDGDGVGDLAVGAYSDDDGGANEGAVWMLFMNADGSLKTETKISDSQGAPSGIGANDNFGSAIASLGDLDGNGVPDIAVGAQLDADGGPNRGAIWILFLDATGSVQSYQKISDTQGGFTGVLDDTDVFGSDLASFGDLDGDGVADLVASAYADDDGGVDRGAVWILFLNTDGTVKAHQKISSTAGGFTGTLDTGDYFGASVTVLGDVDGDTVPDIAVGASADDDGGFNRGALWILFLNTDGTVKGHQKISDTVGGFAGTLNDVDSFGVSVGTIGLLDGDGVVDLVVGSQRDDDGGTDRGAVWVLFLNADGTVKAEQKISDTMGGFGGVLDDSDYFGLAAAGVGDLDGNGVVDIVVGAPQDDDGDLDQGALWLLELNTDGTVASEDKVSDMPGAFSEELSTDSGFGFSAVAVGDLDGDGIVDLAVGEDEAVWLLFLNADGTVKFDEKIGTGEGGFVGPLDPNDRFAWSVASIGDLDGDGVLDIAVGAPLDDDGGGGPGRGLGCVPELKRHRQGGAEDLRHCGRLQRHPHRQR